MKTYGVKGEVGKATGFGWRNFLVSGAKYTGTLTLQGRKSAFDVMMGTLKYEFTLKSVKSWGFDITSFVVDNLGGKKSTSGNVAINGSPLSGSVVTSDGYNIFYSAELKNSWNLIAGKVDVTNKATATTTATAAIVKDDANYDEEIVEPPVTPELPDPNKDEFALAKMHTAKQEVAGWPVISTLTVTYVDKKRIRIDVDEATRSRWPKDASINIHCLLKRNGVWHAGPCDWVKPMPSVKDFKCLCVPDGDSRTYVPDPYLESKAGIVLTLKCRYGMAEEKFRTTVFWLDLPR